MATPLFWKAYQLQNKIYEKILYTHCLSVDVQQEKFNSESRATKLLPFFLSQLNATIHFCTTLYLRCGYIFSADVFPFYTLLLQIYMFLTNGVCISLNYIGFKSGHSFYCELQNMLVRFSKKLQNEAEATIPWSEFRRHSNSLSISHEMALVKGKYHINS